MAARCPERLPSSRGGQCNKDKGHKTKEHYDNDGNIWIVHDDPR